METNHTQPASIRRCEAVLRDLANSIGVSEQTSTKDSSTKDEPQAMVLQKLFASLSSSKVPVRCKVCSDEGTEANSRAYISSNPLQITLCSNRLRGKDYGEVLAHEATHAFDFINKKCDFSTCEGLAYSEVRAARNAECLDSWSWRRRSCIERSATAATANLFPRQAKECVAQVLEAALADNSP